MPEPSVRDEEASSAWIPVQSEPACLGTTLPRLSCLGAVETPTALDWPGACAPPREIDRATARIRLFFAGVATGVYPYHHTRFRFSEMSLDPGRKSPAWRRERNGKPRAKPCRENETVCVAHPSRRGQTAAPQDEVSSQDKALMVRR